MRVTERDKKEGGGRGREGGVEREIVCVYVFVCERVREYMFARVSVPVSE